MKKMERINQNLNKKKYGKMNEDQRGWNTDLIYGIFNIEQGEAIINIPISNYHILDSIY